MKDTTATLPDTGPTPDNSTPWSTHPGYDLSRYTSVVEVAKGCFAFEPATAGEGGAA